MDPRTTEEEKIKKFGLRLKKLRIEKELTQHALAAKACLTASQISRIETGRINPTLTVLDALARALETDIGFLIDRAS